MKRLGCNQLHELLDLQHQRILGFTDLLDYPTVPVPVWAGLILGLS